MALVRQDGQVVIQPSPGFQTSQYGMDKVIEAQNWGKLGDTFQTGFDMVKRDFDQNAVEQAQKDAPALIKRDGTGMTLPVSSFEPPGLTSRAYRDAYKSAAYNLYSSSVEQDYQGFASNVLTAHPTDIDAARKAMEEKRTAVVAGLDPNYAPLITLRLNAMSGQVESKINANVQSEQNQVAEKNAAWAYDNVVLKASQLAVVPDRFDRQTLETNHQLLVADFDRATSLMRQSGWSEPRIAKAWQDAHVKTMIARNTQDVRNWVLTNQNATVEDYTKGLIQIRDEMEKQRQKLGPDGPAYIASMSQALDWASGSNQLRVQANQQQADNRINNATLGWRRTFDGVGSEGSPQFAEVANALKRERNGVYTDPSLTASQKIKALAAYDSVLNTGMTDNGKYVADQLTGLYTTAMHPDTPPQRSKAMMQEIKSIVSDPQSTAYLPTGVRNYGERALSQVAMNTAKTDIFTGMTAGSEGHLPPAELEQVTQKWLDHGWVGDAPNSIMSHPEAALWKQKASAAYLSRQLTQSDAREGQRQWNAGQIPTKAQQASMDAGLPAFQPSDGKSFDIANPTHQADALGRFAGTSSLPQVAIDQIKAVPMGTDPERTKAVAGFVAGVKQTMLARGFKSDQADAFINGQVGTDIGAFLRSASVFGHDAAVKLAIGAPNSVSRNAGQAVDAAATDMGTAIDGMVADILPHAEAGVYSPLANAARTYVPGLSRTPEQAAQLAVDNRYTKLLGDKAPTMGSQFLNDANIFGGKTLTGSFQTTALDPAVRDVLQTGAMAIWKQHGDELKTAFKGQDPMKLAALQAAESLRGQLEWVADPKDATKGTLTWKTANTRFGEIFKANGAPSMGRLSDQETAAYALGAYNAQQRVKHEMGMPNDEIAPFDPATVSVTRVNDIDGSFHWLVAAQEKSGTGTVPLMRLADDDPRLSGFAGDIANAAVHDVSQALGKPLQDRAAKALGGGVVGKAFGFLVGGPAGLLQDTSLKSNIDRRLAEQGDAAPHSGKALVDFLFGSDTSSKPGPVIPYDPALLKPGVLPQHVADWKGMRAAVTKLQGQPDFEEKARNLRLLMQLRNPAAFATQQTAAP